MYTLISVYDICFPTINLMMSSEDVAVDHYLGAHWHAYVAGCLRQRLFKHVLYP